MSYYDTEAPVYDESRGGVDRARAAAVAVAELVPPGGLLVEAGGGTGIVARELADLGWAVLVTDLSHGMLRVAASRLPGRAVRASAARLPLRDGGADVVTAVWLLHLLPVDVADAVVAEAARVLRPGGAFVTTVDKNLAHGRTRGGAADHRERVEAVARRNGLSFAGATSFSGRSRWGSATAGDPVFPLAAFRRR